MLAPVAMVTSAAHRASLALGLLLVLPAFAARADVRSYDASAANGLPDPSSGGDGVAGADIG